MGIGKQKNISLSPWMAEAIEILKNEQNPAVSFAEMARILLVPQLERRGYSEGKWLAKKAGEPWDEEIKQIQKQPLKKVVNR